MPGPLFLDSEGNLVESPFPEDQGAHLQSGPGTAAGTPVFAQAVDSSAIIGYAGNPLSKKTAEGKVFFCGGRAISAYPGGVLCYLGNPVNSGRVLYLYAISIYQNSSNMWVAYYNDMPEPTIPLLTPTNMNHGSSNASVAHMRLGVPAAALTTQYQIAAHTLVTDHQLLQMPPMILPPGHSMSLRFPHSKSLEAAANAYWWEE